MREAGACDQEAHEAAVAAVQQILRLLSRKEASAEALHAYSLGRSDRRPKPVDLRKRSGARYTEWR